MRLARGILSIAAINLVIAGCSLKIDYFDRQMSPESVDGNCGVTKNCASDLDLSFAISGSARFDFDSVENLALYAGSVLAIKADDSVIFSARTAPVAGFSSFVVSKLDSRGQLDPTFATDGHSRLAFGTNASSNILLLENDSIYSAGVINGKRSLTKLTPAGAIDTTFGTSGTVSVSATIVDSAIYKSGSFYLASHRTGTFDLTVSKFSLSGTVDSSFGTAGTSILSLPSDQFGSAVEVATNGDVFIGGQSYVGSATSFDMLVAKLAPSGSLETSFGASGLLKVDFNGKRDVVSQLKLSPDEQKLYAVGYATDSGGTLTDGAVVRLNPDGTLDNSFGAGGKVMLDFSNAGNDMAKFIHFQNDKLFVVGHATDSGRLKVFISKLNLDGSFDLSFNETGTRFYDIGSYSDQVIASQIDSKNRMVLLVRSSNGLKFDAAVARIWL